MMSRTKSRPSVELCGDCGAIDATWASVNKGILLCTQCCSVHRSLGKHISQVKSLLKSQWSPNQLNMVCTLSNNGANNIWEHTLLENGSKQLKKKPVPKDPLSVKQEYIKSKHKDCIFAFRENYEDGLLSVENELGKQLHASVRTANLETSFRLLALGADPNYFHDEKGSTPLHVAIKSEQKLQAELLLVYGADPTCPDAQGKTPIDHAKLLANKDLFHRLVECQYEVTDTFSYYLSMQKPDHSTGIHFLIPQTGFKSNPASLAKLQKLPNHVFEELAMDVFDEVDRRETEAIWLSCADTTDLNDVPFLPVDSTLSSTRNQGRQKLARFSTPELKSLVFDILLDTQRRQVTDKGLKPQLRECSVVPDDDPLYDSVASDDDYALPPSEENENFTTPERSEDTRSIISMENTKKTNYALEQLTKALKASDSTITNLRAEVVKLKQNLKTLENENCELRNRLTNAKPGNQNVNGDCLLYSLRYTENNPGIAVRGPLVNGTDEVDLRQRKNQRPSSMYETREGINKVNNWHALKNEIKQNEQSRNATQSLYASSHERETVLQCTEHITRSIQHLVTSIQNLEKEDCCICAEKVRFSIVKLASTLPKEAEAEIIKLMLKQSSELKDECFALQQANRMNDSKLVERHYTNIREIAFHLAKFTKEIVTKYSSNQ